MGNACRAEGTGQLWWSSELHPAELTARSKPLCLTLPTKGDDVLDSKERLFLSVLPAGAESALVSILNAESALLKVESGSVHGKG